MNLSTIFTILLLVLAASVGVYIYAWKTSGRWYLKRSRSLAAMFRKSQWKLQEKYPDPLMRCWNYPGSTAHENKADEIAEEVDRELKEISLAEQQRMAQQGGLFGSLGSRLGQAHGGLRGLPDEQRPSWFDELLRRMGGGGK